MSQRDIDLPGPSCRHTVQYYDSPAFLAESVARYMADGLRQGQGVVVVCRPQHRQLFEERLEIDGWPSREAPGAIDVKFLDAADVLGQLMVGDHVDEARFESIVGKVLWQSGRGGRRMVRVYGEVVSLLCERGKFSEAVRLERFWNAIARRHSMSLLCGYRVSHFGSDGVAHHFENICAEHDEVLPSEEWMRLDRRAQLRRVADLERQEARQTQLLSELREALRRQAETDRHKDEFLAMLGHELRNPLAPIFTALELMSMRGDTTSLREREVIRRQTLHLTRLVDDLLDVSRVARGKIELEKEPIELSELAARAVEIASPLFEAKRHHLTISIPRTGLLVDVDVVRLSQVLANLLGNAAKYTEPEGRVSITGRRAGAEIVVEVADNGNGIPFDLLPTIFDVFVQGDQAIDRAQGGLGLGLALVKNLTRLHGGNVSAHSDGLGKGSTFVVRLPALEESMTAHKRLNACRAADASGVLRKVLLVDDNEDAADVLAELLRLKGCDVAVAHDGAEALALATGVAHDVALVDIGLPVMDGYELADRLREVLGASVPKLIAVTGYGQDSDRERTRQAGFAAHLVKPVSLDELILAIKQA